MFYGGGATTKTLNKLILIVFIVIGSFLRIYNIGFQCLWTEEQYSLNISSLNFLDIVFKSFASDFNPPVYYIFAHLSLLLTNGLNFSIRYPSVICGILLIPVMYWIGVTYKDELTGIYCAGLTTIILPFIYYSQFGRAYAMSILFFALALVYYIRLKDGDENTKTRVLFWALAVLNVWIHLFAAIPIGLMCLDLLLDKKNWLCGIGAGICSFPLIGMIINTITTRTHAAYNYGASMLQMAVLTFPEFFNTVFLNVLLLAAVGAWLHRDKINKILMIITILTLIVGIFSAAITPMFPRYMMTTSIIILLFSASGLVALTELLNKKVRWDLTYVVMIGVFIVFSWMLFPNLESHYFVQQY